MNERILAFEGIHNFRDYGDYGARDGARIARRRLYSSAQHADATPADLDAVARLGIGTVVDLRGNSERQSFPCARHPEFSARVLFADGETAGSAHAPHVEAARQVRTAEEAHAAMVSLYETMAFRPNLVTALTLYFEAMAEEDHAHLLHCLAGKDRTGLAVALTHSLLGVHRDDVMADYLLTNIAGNIEARIAQGADVVRGNFGHDMEDAAVRALMSVHPGYLDTALRAIASAHGSVRNYAREILGVSDDRLAKIESRLLE